MTLITTVILGRTKCYLPLLIFPFKLSSCLSSYTQEKGIKRDTFLEAKVCSLYRIKYILEQENIDKDKRDELLNLFFLVLLKSPCPMYIKEAMDALSVIHNKIEENNIKELKRIFYEEKKKVIEELLHSYRNLSFVFSWRQLL